MDNTQSADSIRLVHQYFIEGGFDKAPAEVVPFNPMAWGNQNGD